MDVSFFLAENVNEYLRLSSNADKQQQQRIKQLFEKKNQKSTQTVAQLQRKLESYQVGGGSLNPRITKCLEMLNFLKMNTAKLLKL